MKKILVGLCLSTVLYSATSFAGWVVWCKDDDTVSFCMSDFDQANAELMSHLSQGHKAKMSTCSEPTEAPVYPGNPDDPEPIEN